MTASLRARLVAAALFVSTAALGTGCDLTTKHWAEETLRDVPGQTLSLIAPHVDVTLRFNEGTAFSAVRDLGGARAALGVFAIVVAVALFGLVVRAPGRRLHVFTLGLIAGGAIGNGVDRIARPGVVDFIEIHYPWGGSWPAFNVADVLLAVSVALWVVLSWCDARGAPEEPAPLR